MVKSNIEEYIVDLEDLCKMFCLPENIVIEHTEVSEGNLFQDKFVYHEAEQRTEYNFSFTLNDEFTVLHKKSYRKRMVKNFLYSILSKKLNKNLPWGSLTGVRPTKFARELIAYGEMKEHLVSEMLQKDYFVSPEKAHLVAMILKNQKGIIRNDNLVDLYINIPVCPSRCLYCSFISSEYSMVKDKLESYIDAMIKELDAVKDIMKERVYLVRNVYIGGGTPSVLSAEQLDRLLSQINFPITEFTVECGRPDTITREKLQVLKKHKVSRISINPQTFCEATLKRIGRKHKVGDVLNAYGMALEEDFIVNMDIIAGLPGERFATFKKTMTTLLELSPHNITVHTLSVKNGAQLKDNTQLLSEKDITKMIDYSQKTLLENGYKPYYLYRQKNQLCGLENVGYFRDEYLCAFNIDSMEETNTIIGIGAGAISKRVYNLEKKITRESNAKFIEDYIARIDEIIDKKKIFFK